MISENEDCTFSESKPKIYSNYVYFIDKLVKRAKLINEKREFPILGICLGFQSMFLSLTEFQIPISYNLKNLGRIQEINWDISNGGAWKNIFKESDIRKMKSQRLLFSNHQFGYEKFNLDKFDNLNNNIIPLAYLQTPYDKTLLAAYRHPRYPFYGLQYHPEASQFLKSDRYNIIKNDKMVKIGVKHSKILKILLKDKRSRMSNNEINKIKENMKIYTDRLNKTGRIYFVREFENESIYESEL